MKIVVINGNSNLEASQNIEKSARSVIDSKTQLVMVTPEDAPKAIEGYYSETLSAKAVLEEVARHKEQADAYVLACFSDPGLHAARSIVNVPVIGIAEAAMHTAVQIAHNFSILTPLHRFHSILMRLVRSYHMEDYCAGVETFEAHVSEAASQSEDIYGMCLKIARIAVGQKNAESVILGGAVMAGMEQRLTIELGVPVLDPVKCAVAEAEKLAKLGLMTSKTGGYAVPFSVNH
ncbi:MAG: aspartate/glutamate racemase family protein [Anaerolineaceae bacterium]|jgi:allantoin racemase|nr:aspartate/glutamate racemase family protein [Anaerolineaceae bacterium]